MRKRIPYNSYWASTFILPKIDYGSACPGSHVHLDNAMWTPQCSAVIHIVYIAGWGKKPILVAMPTVLTVWSLFQSWLHVPSRQQNCCKLFKCTNNTVSSSTFSKSLDWAPGILQIRRKYPKNCDESVKSQFEHIKLGIQGIQELCVPCQWHKSKSSKLS